MFGEMENKQKEARDGKRRRRERSQSALKARSDVLRKTHQPRLFFTHAKNAAS